MLFNELHLDERIMLGINDAGFTQCTPVQASTFKHSLSGKDICAQSQTGTGKTAAFLVTIFHNLLNNRGKKAMIIVPTRELAVQVENDAHLLGAHLDFKVACIYGGVGYTLQEKQLKGGAEIIVGTPGRMLDLHQSRKLSFKDVDILVIDEADRLFDMGFMPDLKRMLKAMPPSHKRQTMLFSATLSFLVKELAWRFMNEPEEVEIAPDRLLVETVTQELYHVGNEEKMQLLLGLLNKENPDNCLIFTNMKHTAETVARRLKMNGIICEYITGDLNQKERTRIIEGLKHGQIRILVATNVASRGLHVDNLDLVVNYDLPEDCEDYVHRIGRTARAGKEGKAISLACEDYIYCLEAIEKYLGMKIPVVWAEEGMLVQDKSHVRRSRSGQSRSQGSRSGSGPRRGGRNRKAVHAA
jgi:ATP-dependent RNA helicase RhlB